MNALVRKFRVASTTGVVMSLAMAGVLAMAPMSNAMAKSQKGKIANVTGSSTFGGVWPAWGDWVRKADKVCGGVYNYKILGSDTHFKVIKVGRNYIYKAKIKCE